MLPGAVLDRLELVASSANGAQAHIEYFRGITNPIGVKVGPSPRNAPETSPGVRPGGCFARGPSMKNDELKELVQAGARDRGRACCWCAAEALNPNKEEGRQGQTRVGFPVSQHHPKRGRQTCLGTCRQYGHVSK